MVRAPRRVASLALALAMAGTVPALAQAGAPDPAPDQPDAAEGFATTVEDVVVDLAPTEAADGTPLEAATSAAVEPFTMIGASYESADPDRGRIRVRVDGTWTRWFPITEVDGDHHGPDVATGEVGRPASEPIWIGAGEAFEIRVPGDVTTATVHLVRDSTASADAPRTSAATTTSTPPPVAADTQGGGYTAPVVRPRSDWGAANYRGTPSFAAGLDRAVVHHTVNGNGYSAAQVPSMLRSIQSYHQNTRGWDDIGYNFVLDRFGTVWEARAGSLYRPTVGAHAENHNDGTVGVAYLGDGSGASLSATATTSLGRFLGWKLSLHGTRPNTNNIVGHRNVGQTNCPGNLIFGQLGQIRTRAIQLAPPAGPFFDVPDSDPRARHLRWGRNSSVIDARVDGTFLPGARVIKADALLWLWRLSGSPMVGTGHGFDDIPGDAYYRDAARWARNVNVLPMTSDRRFRPNQQVTRQSFVLQIWRSIGRPDPAVGQGYSDVPVDAPNQVAYDWSFAYRLVNTPAFGGAAKLDRSQAVQLLYRIRRFDDVPKSHFASEAITWSAHRAIATGYADNTFRPSDGVTREQGLVWIWRTMGRPDTPAPPDDGFTDDDEGAWYAAALDWADDVGWVEAEGGSGDDFGPGSVLTRGDAVSWVWRIAGSTATTVDHPFSDVSPSLDDAVDWAHDHGIVNGFEDGTFRPGQQVNRAQFVRMLNQLANTPDAWSVDPPPTVEF